VKVFYYTYQMYNKCHLPNLTHKDILS